MKARHLSLDALILKVAPQGEADLWVTLLSPVAGLLHARAPVALKSQKRFMGALMTGVLESVSLVRRHEVWFLEEAQVRSGFSRAKATPSSYALICYAVEAVLATHPEGPAGSPAFPLLMTLLECLDNGESDLPLCRLAWDFRLLDALGLAPDLGPCVECSVEVQTDPVSFDARAGGVLCSHHAAGSATEISLSRLAVFALGQLRSDPFPIPPGVAPAPRDRKAMRIAVDQLMTWHLPLESRSLTVLKQLSKVSTRQILS